MLDTAAYRRWLPLFRNLVRREVRQRYKGSLFGLAWTFVNPMIVVATYSAVFHYIFPVVNIPHYGLFLFTGLTVWTFFLGGIQVASSSIVGNANLVKKVRFPREIIPLAHIFAAGVTAGAMFLIALPMCLVVSNGLTFDLWALIPFTLFLVAFTCGLGLALAGLNVYLRDVEHIVGAIGMPWFFATPIFYTFESMPSANVSGTVLKVLYFGNPITPFLSSIRQIMFYGSMPTMGSWVYCAVVGIVVLVCGALLFRRMSVEMASEL